jgi:predicted ATP-binding protein involved in virulence
MFIKRIRLTNFKGFSGESEWLEFSTPNDGSGSGLNILVGENNTGKSTLFEAVDFLRNGSKKSPTDIKNKNAGDDADTRVEVEFEGDIESAINGFSQPNKIAVFQRYVYESEGVNLIRLSRSLSSIKSIELWSNDDSEYKNESGIDAPVKKLFEMNFVWADTNPEDQTSFGASTVCGNLLKGIAQDFTDTPDYQAFSDIFHRTFNAEDSALREKLRDVEERTQAVFRQQFGSAEIHFRFNELEVDSFFKKTEIDIDDGTNTAFQEKGSGMQRSVALALLQVYADELTRHPENQELKKPFFLFVDEPELCLHPIGQKNLLRALLELSKTKQVFLATHSPYFLISEHLNQMGLFVFRKADDNSSFAKLSQESGSLPWSPTWGEINYRAFNLPTVELHNELYGYLQEKSECWNIGRFDRFLNDKGIDYTKEWTREQNGGTRPPEAVTVQTFIRNKVHHPENRTMNQIGYTDEEFSLSIQQMIDLINGLAE